VVRIYIHAYETQGKLSGRGYYSPVGLVVLPPLLPFSGKRWRIAWSMGPYVFSLSIITKTNDNNVKNCFLWFRLVLYSSSSSASSSYYDY